MGRRKKAESVTEDAKSAKDSASDEVEVTVEGAETGDTAKGAEDSPAPGDEQATESEDWHDRYLRLVAEFDNFRKRSAREFGNLVVSAERELIGDLTEVLDNFERALKADHKGESVDEFAKGVALIRDQLWDVLGRRGLKRVEALGTPFDPEAHDALMKIPSDEYDEGIVAQEVSPGYHLGEKVLRHAKVVVSQGKAPADSEADDNES
jgi:molecular chaperone GrpE